VCTSHLSFPKAMQAWANAYHGEDSSGGAGRPDSAVFATTELVGAPAEGVSIEDVWEKRYSGFFKVVPLAGCKVTLQELVVVVVS
jgi:hypothetical protein